MSRSLCGIQAGSACAIQDTCRPVCQTVRALIFTRDLTHFEVLHVHHTVDHVLLLFAEWVVRLILLQVCFQRFWTWVRFNLMNQLSDCFTGPIFVFPRIHPFALDKLSSRGNVHSRHELGQAVYQSMRSHRPTATTKPRQVYCR